MTEQQAAEKEAPRGTCAGCSAPLYERRAIPGGVRLRTCDTPGCPGNLACLGVNIPPEPKEAGRG